MTSTTLSCSPNPVMIDAAATCTAVVKDTGGSGATAPDGQVAFSSSGSDIASGVSCPESAGELTCAATFVPHSLSADTVTATYQAGDGDTVHASSSATTTLSVVKRTTSTTVSCAPDPVAYSELTTCTSTVTDGGPSGAYTPAGTVALSSSGTGGQSRPACTLTNGDTPGSASCSINYRPWALDGGAHTITARYAPSSKDTIHLASSGTTQLGINKRATSTTVSCSPDELAAGVLTTCTFTVKDTGSTQKTTPTGTVALSSDGPGSQSAKTCPLAAGASTGTATCAINYRPSAVGGYTITGTYTPASADTVHWTSTGRTVLETAERTVSTTLSCSPTTVAVNQPTKCTATVTDTAAGTKSTPTGSIDWNGGEKYYVLARTGTTGVASTSWDETFSSAGSESFNVWYVGDSLHWNNASNYVSITVTGTAT